MSSSQRFPEDLLVHARRGELSPEEEKSLGALLATSETACLWYQAGIGFDAESPVLPGDEELLGRVTERVAKASSGRISRRWWRIAWPAAAASLVATSAAAGGWILLQRSLRAGPPAAATELESPPGSPRHAPSLAQSAGTPRTETPSPSEPAVPVARSAPPGAPTVPRLVEGPSELFERANRARREGRIGEAMALYERLSSVAPGTPEAQQAELALGELNLQKGTPDRALLHFRRYRGQAMGAEALWGEARALRQLGRSAEERATLDTLGRRFPSSPYAAPARKRLAGSQE